MTQEEKEQALDEDAIQKEKLKKNLDKIVSFIQEEPEAESFCYIVIATVKHTHHPVLQVSNIPEKARDQILKVILDKKGESFL